MHNRRFRILRTSLFLATGLLLCVGGAAMAADTVDSLRASEIQLRNTIEQQPTNGALRIQLAKVYLKLGNSNAAIAELIVAHQLKADDNQVAPLTAQAMVESGDFENALRDVPEGKRPANVESDVRTYRAMAQLGIGETENAKASLAAAERLNPRNIICKIEIARMLLDQKQFQAASNKIDEALAISPNDSAALDLKGLAREFLGDQAGASGYFSRSIASNPRNTQALLDRAGLEANHNQLDLATKDITAVKTIAPHAAMSAYLDAVVKAKLGKYQDADNALDKIRPAMESVPDVYFLAGEIKFKLNQMAQAEAYFDKFIAHRQDEPQAYQMLGLLALQRGDTDRAVTMLEKAHDLAPKDSGVAVALAQAYLAHNEAAKAVSLMDAEVIQQPNNAGVQSERALAHFTFGDPGASEAELNSLFKGGNGDLKAGPSLILMQMRSGQVDAAAKTAQTLAQREPSNTLYQELLGAARVSQHNYPAAEGIFQAILAKQPTLDAARQSLAQVYISTNRPDAAIKLFQDWIAKNPHDMKAIQSLAAIYVQRKDDAGALKLFSDTKVLSTGDAPAGVQVAMIYERQRNWPQAIATVTALQTRFPNNQLIMDTLGRLYSESGDTKASVAAYGKATAAFPQSISLWNDYATALANAKNYPAALDAMNKARALAPTNLRIERGYLYLTFLAQGPQAAAAAAQAFSGNTPQSPTGIFLVAEILANNGKTADAIAALQATQAKVPTASGAILLGKYLASGGQKAAAIATLEAWAKSHPNDYDPRFALAQLYGSNANYAMALQEFEWLESQRPNDSVVLNNLAWLYSQKNDPRARDVAMRAYKAAPQSGQVADTLGWIVTNQGDPASGVKYLQIASTEAPNDPSVQYHLAFALTKLNQAASARPILQKVLNSSADASVKESARQLLAKIGQ